MRDQDFDAFAAMLDDVRALLPSGQPSLSATAKAMFFRALAAHSIADVRAALDAHVRDPKRGRFAPTPADVIEQLIGMASDDGRPEPDEAWATAVQAASEWQTVVWSAETAQAWAIARPVLDAGDEVGARMAFRDAYRRLVDEARASRTPPRWDVSLGWDMERRRIAIEAAVQAGRLSGDHVEALPAPAEAGTLALCFRGHAAEPEFRARIAELRQEFAERANAPILVDDADRRHTEGLKARAAAAIEAYQRAAQPVAQAAGDAQ